AGGFALVVAFFAFFEDGFVLVASPVRAVAGADLAASFEPTDDRAPDVAGGEGLRSGACAWVLATEPSLPRGLASAWVPRARASGRRATARAASAACCVAAPRMAAVARSRSRAEGDLGSPRVAGELEAPRPADRGGGAAGGT